MLSPQNREGGPLKLAVDGRQLYSELLSNVLCFLPRERCGNTAGCLLRLKRVELLGLYRFRIQEDEGPIVTLRSFEHQVVVAYRHFDSRNRQFQMGVERGPEIVAASPSLTAGECIELGLVLCLPL